MLCCNRGHSCLFVCCLFKDTMKNMLSKIAAIMFRDLKRKSPYNSKQNNHQKHLYKISMLLFTTVFNDKLVSQKILLHKVRPHIMRTKTVWTFKTRSIDLKSYSMELKYINKLIPNIQQSCYLFSV